MGKIKMFLFWSFFPLLLAGCTGDPEPIVYGKDNCKYCLMLISDTKYGAELITDKGKIYKYDSVECLAAHSNDMSSHEISSMWVVNFSPPHELINVNDSRFLLSDNLRSPMGLYLSAFKEESKLDEVKNEYGGKKIEWEKLVEYVSGQWD